MRKARMLILLLSLPFFCALTVGALEISPPEVPQSGEIYMPDSTDSFSQALWYVLRTGIEKALPEVAQAAKMCVGIFAVCILTSAVENFPGTAGPVLHLCASVMLGLLLLEPANSLISLGTQTVTEMTQYGKLLIPVMTGALAAQGQVTASAALCTGSSFFCSLLSGLVSKLIVPMLYLYFCTSVICSALGEEMAKKLRDLLKWLITWGLKLSLYLFSGYLGITGVVSGAADASAVKVAKLTLSGMVPVVGNILSEASETVLVGASVMKNSAGVYGLIAIVAVFIGPFLQIGTQYLLLKITGGVCSLFGTEKENALLQDFSNGMGMVLAMTGCVCLFLLIAVVCFLKGVGA